MDHDIFLESERLFLRQFVAEDASLLEELDSDPEVMRYLTRGKPTSRDRIEQEILPRFLSYYERFENLGYWAAHIRATGDFIGWFHLRPEIGIPEERPPKEVELGYRLKRSAWGKDTRPKVLDC